MCVYLAFYTRICLLLDPILGYDINTSHLPALQCDETRMAPTLVSNTIEETQYRTQCEMSKKSIAIRTPFDAENFVVADCYTNNPCSSYKAVMPSYSFEGMFIPIRIRNSKSIVIRSSTDKDNKEHQRICGIRLLLSVADIVPGTVLQSSCSNMVQLAFHLYN